MMKIPYGDSYYPKIIRQKKYYVDRTMYLETLEAYSSDYIFFVRPRRFGKSLFLSMMEHYYGIQYKSAFEELFGQQYIGKHPTPLANQYLILKFDFSQIDTSSFENTYNGFLTNVKINCKSFLLKYSQFFNEDDIAFTLSLSTPAAVIQNVLTLTNAKIPNQKIYLLIDEYDHFANEILSFRFDEFSQMISQNGFVRKFYEAVKVGTQIGVIDKLFVTGISPLTLDSLTSGFNIATNISLQRGFNEMLGFTELEVKDLLKRLNLSDAEVALLIGQMRTWYNGYRFYGGNVKNRVYNSDMVLYFAKEYLETGTYPMQLLDPNIASDYKKVRRLFKIGQKEKEHLRYLETLLKTGLLKGKLTVQFELDKKFDYHDFISILYYSGILTIVDIELDSYVFKMPNYVIKQLYFQYFYQITKEENTLKGNQVDVHEKIKVLALENKVKPLVEFTEAILSELAVRDNPDSYRENFDEKYVKAIFTAALFTSGIYTIHNEFEVKKSKQDKGFVDILLVKRAPFKPKFQFVFELKYLKKADKHKAEKVKKEAIEQLKNYLKHDTYLQKMEALKAYVIMFVGNKGEFVALQ